MKTLLEKMNSEERSDSFRKKVGEKTNNYISIKREILLTKHVIFVGLVTTIHRTNRVPFECL